MHFRSLTVAGALAMLSSTAWADCTPFDAFSPEDGRQVAFNDLDEDGEVSTGDVRIGVRKLIDANGAEIGERYWIITVQDGANGKATSRLVDTINVFADGSIFSRKRNEIQPSARVEDTSQRQIPQEPLSHSITGGLGAYKGARGTVEITPEDLSTTYRFDVTCK